MNRQIFVSYAKEDRSIAERLHGALSAFDEVRVWLDTRDLLPGADWEEEIISAIERSDSIILLLSDASINKTGYVQREVRAAIERLSLLPPGERLVIPIRISACVPRHRALTKLQWVDLFPTWEPGFSQLLTGLGLHDHSPKLRFTHKYYVPDNNTKGRRNSYILPIGATPSGDDYWDTTIEPILISMSHLPPFDTDLIYNVGLTQANFSSAAFFALWTKSSTGWSLLYRKQDWRDLDRAIFTPHRTHEDIAVVADTFPRLWAVARQLGDYDEQEWVFLYKLLFRVTA